MVVADGLSLNQESKERGVVRWLFRIRYSSAQSVAPALPSPQPSRNFTQPKVLPMSQRGVLLVADQGGLSAPVILPSVRCTRLFALAVVRRLKFPLNPGREGPSIVAVATIM